MFSAKNALATVDYPFYRRCADDVTSSGSHNGDQLTVVENFISES